jgi:two-component system, OmpR family, response regulator
MMDTISSAKAPSDSKRHIHAPPLAHILAVDDDRALREGIAAYLADYNFRVTAVGDSRAMYDVLDKDVVDLIVMDLRLGREDGMAIAGGLREESAIPIIMLTSRQEEADRVMGLELAADDYLTKPCSPRELLARIRAVLRRRRAELQQGRPEGVRAYRFDDWELNLNTRRLTAPDGRVVRLSNGEFGLLVVLLGAPQRILSRNQILEMSRLHGADVYSSTVNTQILRLRRKIEQDPARPGYICAERGVGYVFNSHVDIVY